MKYESYDAVRVADDLSSVDFISEGKHGPLFKRILFVPSKVENAYDLVFGNLVAGDDIDDFSVNDNGDRNKILATVAQAVNKYTKRYPYRMIYIIGSTIPRTRLYRMAIGLNLDELSLTFDIYARTEKGYVPFCKNMEVIAFLIKRKSFDQPFTTI
ncbi:DUF6934 family protein [Puia sp.]|jgi:hypothetical protein|uniref:DUF6934 family protein n=1 Tax=Puia sp. TaxID=2045100 RepID=UPI002F41897F